MKRLTLLCLVPLCVGPFQTDGEATEYLWWQPRFAMEHHQIVPVAGGYDVQFELEGSGTQANCTAQMHGPAVPFCQGLGVVMENGVVRRQ